VQQGAGLANEQDATRGDANRDRFVTAADLNLWMLQFAAVPSGIPNSVYFKLYFDPAGIIEGQVTAVVDGGGRYALGAANGLVVADDRYDFDVVESIGPNSRFEGESFLRPQAKSGSAARLRHVVRLSSARSQQWNVGGDCGDRV